ncbi:MAG: ferrous iron transport protein B [Deltaproteobacteria bacterium]|nr:ferrous iron transport protein B [Deltaproteobacteria bacterium]
MKKKFTIALSGNPNAGKTTVFNAITGARQEIANYPGVTVEKKVGKVTHKGHEMEVVDLPGTYSLTAYSLEEIVARDFLVNERPDLVVDIVDASNLDRNLYLAVQFRELGIPLVIALNMMDVAESRGITVDHKELSELFEVPVIPMVARANKGIRELLDKVVEVAGDGDEEWLPAAISYGMDIDRSIDEIDEIIRKSTIFDPKYPSRWRALKCLERDKQIVDLLKRDPALGEQIDTICRRIFKHIMNTLEDEPEGIIADHRYGFIAGITKKAVKRKIESRINVSDKIDKVLTSRVIGPVIMLAILYAIYEFTFWASEGPVGWFEAFFEGLSRVVSSVLPEGHLQSMIVSGVIDGVGGVLGFVPLIMFMFFAIAIMEDSGYMARVAYMLDRVLRWFGLHGNSVMALIISGGISGGCAVPGVMAARTLRDPKERIATLLVVPFMNCGAKLPVYAVLIAAFFSAHKARMLFILTLLSWAFALFAAKIIRSTVLKGPKTPFVMELPPYRMPTLRGLLIHTWERTWQYIKKAGTVILGISIILWVMMTFPEISPEKLRSFEDSRQKITKSFLASPDVKGLLKDEKALTDLNELFDSYEQAIEERDMASTRELEKKPLFPLVRAADFLEKEDFSEHKIGSAYLNAAARYINYKNDMIDTDISEQQVRLKGTVAGWMGRKLETITRPLGFDYRTNIALVGGFAAKEVVISTLGTAYSLGDVEPDEAGSLSQRLKNEPNWNPLLAFTLIIFTMLYVPCFVTVVMIRRESSWKWAGFSIGFNLIVAYLVALVIRQVGLLLGLGV